MASGISLLCFAASYAVALGVECVGLASRWQSRRLAVLLATAAGLVAHTLYLGKRAALMPATPLGNHQDWFIAAAWLLALAYLAALIYYRRASLGVFLLPVVLALLVASVFASDTPIASFQAPRVWGRLHGLCLMFGTVAVLIGFVTGLLYLWQSNRLKNKQLPITRLPLPSMEWLQRVNNVSLPTAAVLVGVGLFTGILARVASEPGLNFVPWTDPVVLSLGAMFAWLGVTEVFRLFYPPAREGRKVAYLTISAAGFLALVLLSFARTDSLHSPAAPGNSAGEAGPAAETTAGAAS